MGRQMTPAARRILEELAADDKIDLVAEGIIVYCGNRQTSHKPLRQLIGLMAVSITFGGNNGLVKDHGPTYYGINHTGRALLRRPELEGEIREAIVAHRPFTIIDDKLAPVDALYAR